MTDPVESIKRNIQIAIAERADDRKIFQKAAELLGKSNDLQWVLANVMTNLIADWADKEEGVTPPQFMNNLRDDVVEFFETFV